MKLGEAKALDIDAISTGCLSVDLALGIGGVPRGRIIEIYGPESSGKTTLAQHVVAEVQKAGGIAAFVDAEHALDPDYAEKIGINLETLYVSQPDTGEQALEIVETLVRSNAVDVIVVDSVAALTPQAEIEGDMGEKQTRRDHIQVQHDRNFHQPDPHEDRGPLRQPGNHHRGQRPQILCLGADRNPPCRSNQASGKNHREPGETQGRQKQSRATLPPRGI
jgi:hypothetical protein